MPHTAETRRRAWAKMKNLRVQWLSENGPCVVCGSSENLEVDHIDRTKKKSHAVWSWSIERREAELSKCQVLCRPCHIQKTKKELGYPEHSKWGYRNGCRCRPCTDFHVETVRKYRLKYGRKKY